MLQLKIPRRDPYPGEETNASAGILNYASRHRFAQLGVAEFKKIGAPVSYARAAYHAIHTFIVEGENEVRRPVRFSWQPVAGVGNTNPDAPPVDDYLRQELEGRLQRWPARFVLMMTIGEAGDAIADPTRPWPARRVRIVMGTLTLTGVPEDQASAGEQISFNPLQLVRGIEPSADPILHARRDAYEVSREMRGGTACPFSTGVAPMANDESWFGKFVNELHEKPWFKCAGAWTLVPIWARLTPVKPLPGGVRPSIQPGDNLQSMMNLIMPLKTENRSPIGRAAAALAIAKNRDQIFAGLDNVGTVHFARFVIVNDNICMFSVYDGDFTNYIRDFIATDRRCVQRRGQARRRRRCSDPLRGECRSIHPMDTRARPVSGAGHPHRFSRKPRNTWRETRPYRPSMTI